MRRLGGTDRPKGLKIGREQGARLKSARLSSLELCWVTRSLRSGTRKQPKEEVFGPDIPRTSRGHSRGCPGSTLRSGPSTPWKNKHFGADIHDPKARMSTTLRNFQKSEGVPISGPNPRKHSIFPQKDATSGRPKKSRSYPHPSHPPLDALSKNFGVRKTSG